MTSSAIGRAVAAVTAVSILFLLLLFFTTPGRTHTGRFFQITRTPSAFLPLVQRDPTPTPGAVIRIIHIYLPRLLPKAYEYVEIENQGGSPQVLTGWRLKNEVGGEVYQFPDFTLAQGRTVKVYSRIGFDDDDELYWNHTAHNFPIWHSSDTACLYAQDWTQVHCFP
jgi:hypothetical protein